MKQYLENDLDIVKLIEVFDELPIWSAPFGLKLLDYVDYKPNISVLDIGFCTGFPLTELAMRLGDTAVVYGIDPWKETFDRVRKKIELYKIANIRLIEGVAENIPLDDNSIDLITSNNGVNNVADIEKVFSECKRIMKPGGQFIQTMNTDKSMFEFYLQLENVFADLGMNNEIKVIHEHIETKRPAIKTMIAMLQKHGFVVKDLEYEQFNYKFANATAMFNHYFIRLAFMESWKKLIPKDKTDEIFSLVESRMNRQAEQFGGLKLSIPYVMINAIKDLK
ncbi:MAG: methyltransferase domain-containing protein [Prevotellaceae bacterium]|jgi:ubiquinone/menaquinone biosynthesis C-methylase UbiE|nr:methyltransferase domain-containing protein [Prevotellaceae bacterium]